MSQSPDLPQGAAAPAREPELLDGLTVGERPRRGPRRLPRASLTDTVRALVLVLLPLLARGLIVRRPSVVGVAERLDLDRRAVREMQRLHERYGEGPLILRLGVRRLALILEPSHVQRVLQASPEPFSAANTEKAHALGSFQPEGVLISEGREREDRRRFNEEVLDTDAPVHRDGETFLRVVDEEAERLGDRAEAVGRLTWEDFVEGWYRMVRTVVLGSGARDDHELTDLLAQLRAKANWSYLRPTDGDLRDRFLERLRTHVERAEPGSLAASMAQAPTTDVTAPVHQVPQWLFAYEPGGMAAYRALALLSAHPDTAEAVRDEVAAAQGGGELPLLRASVLESLRLWPTTPGILRDATVDTRWERGVLPAGTGVLVFAPYLHRDDRYLPEADRFAPSLWLHGRDRADVPLVPFSDGPVVCPGRNVVLLTTSAMLAGLLRRYRYELHDPTRLDRRRPMPALLSPFDLTFDIHPAEPTDGR